MARTRQRSSTTSHHVAQKKAKSVFAIADTNEKKAKKLQQLDQMLSSMSTMQVLTRQRAIYQMRPIPPVPDTHVKCPECENLLTAHDVERGFTKDHYDWTTQCPQCKHRFMTTSVFEVLDQKDTVVWLCEEQTLQAIADVSAEMDAAYQEEYDDALLQELVKRPSIVWNMMRYALKADLTILEWLKERLPEIETNYDEEFYRQAIPEEEEEESAPSPVSSSEE